MAAILACGGAATMTGCDAANVGDEIKSVWGEISGTVSGWIDDVQKPGGTETPGEGETPGETETPGESETPEEQEQKMSIYATYNDMYTFETIQKWNAYRQKNGPTDIECVYELSAQGAKNADEVTWSIAWKNPESDFAKGKNIKQYASFTGRQGATSTSQVNLWARDIGEQIVVTCADKTTGVSVSKTLDFYHNDVAWAVTLEPYDSPASFDSPAYPYTHEMLPDGTIIGMSPQYQQPKYGTLVEWVFPYGLFYKMVSHDFDEEEFTVSISPVVISGYGTIYRYPTNLSVRLNANFAAALAEAGFTVPSGEVDLSPALNSRKTKMNIGEFFELLCPNSTKAKGDANARDFGYVVKSYQETGKVAFSFIIDDGVRSQTYGVKWLIEA